MGKETVNPEAGQTFSGPTVEQLEGELNRFRYRRKYFKALRGTIYTLVIVSAVSVLVATLLMPVLRIYGKSMTPTLYDGEIVVSVKQSDFHRGDIVAFYYDNKVLVKRVIAMPGEWVNITEDGQLYINDILQEEDYLEEGAQALGECNIELPYQVPEGKVFVMGDHRSVSIDSRNTSVGCISKEQLVGKLIFKIWPLKKAGAIK